jgi:hypothetical protein
MPAQRWLKRSKRTFVGLSGHADPVRRPVNKYFFTDDQVSGTKPQSLLSLLLLRLVPSMK